jgi:hypothetical protein
MEPYPAFTLTRDDFSSSLACFEQLITRLCAQDMTGCTAQVLEDFVTTRGGDVERRLIQDQIDARARHEVRLARVVGADEVVRRRAEPGHTRLVATTVGRVEVPRIAYRAPGVPSLHPADAHLALPEHIYSYPLRRQVVCATATGSTREAAQTLLRATGQRIGTRQLMEITEQAARDVRDFYQRPTHTSVDPATVGDTLVLSIDATGVNVIDADLRGRTRADRATGRRPPSAQLARRDRRGRARMAVVTAIYDATPVPRTAADVLPVDAGERGHRRPGPRAGNRRVNASLEYSTTPMVVDLFDQAHRRDPDRRRRWVVVVDGANHQLDQIRAEAKRRGVHVDIVIDFIHVLEYCWGAAADCHATHHARAAFVQTHARALLEGHTERVIADLRALRDARGGADQPAAPGLERAIAYLTAKAPYLNYQVALALGWPIASGVIEGACRHLVKDRLDITGARWSLAGAEAVLLLRAVIVNGDFDAYWGFHTDQEYQRNHASRYKDQQLALVA